MNKLRGILQSKLKTIHSRVYFKKASEKATFPYIVFDFLPTIEDGQGHTIVPFDVDGWDDTEDTTALEALMANVKAGLDKWSYKDNEIGAIFFLDSRLTLTDDEERLSRRKYTFQARIFEL